MDSKAFLIHEAIDFDNLNLKISKVKLRQLRNDEVLIKNEYIGVNDIDYQQLAAIYPVKYPFIPGCESVGRVVAINSNMKHGFKEGDRVVCCNVPFGAYSDYRIVNMKNIIPVPSDIPSSTIVSFLYKAMYASMLVFNTYFLKKEVPILINNPYRSVGYFICQYAKGTPCNIIGTVDSKNLKGELFLHSKNPVNLLLKYDEENFVERVSSFTKGIGVGAIFDSLSDKNNLSINIKCLMNWGMYVLYDEMRSSVRSININSLRNKSLFFSRPNFFLQKNWSAFFLTSAIGVIEDYASKKINAGIYKEYPFKDAKRALLDLKEGKDVGESIVLKV
ncbi:alcohol dehydrogenase catalytic domain-containing protein [Anaplasmataceae bacterium AB001_6]|nr:alcohol dehydrogenase catalytic domain-containing protein [Anaplasmataceae bacterium AB001_6]